jgi:hypothetical protein
MESRIKSDVYDDFDAEGMRKAYTHKTNRSPRANYLQNRQGINKSKSFREDSRGYMDHILDQKENVY